MICFVFLLNSRILDCFRQIDGILVMRPGLFIICSLDPFEALFLISVRF